MPMWRLCRGSAYWQHGAVVVAADLAGLATNCHHTILMDADWTLADGGIPLKSAPAGRFHNGTADWRSRLCP
jgi:hypothetical protein